MAILSTLRRQLSWNEMESSDHAVKSLSESQTPDGTSPTPTPSATITPFDALCLYIDHLPKKKFSTRHKNRIKADVQAIVQAYEARLPPSPAPSEEAPWAGNSGVCPDCGEMHPLSKEAPQAANSDVCPECAAVHSPPKEAPSARKPCGSCTNCDVVDALGCLSDQMSYMARALEKLTHSNTGLWYEVRGLREQADRCERGGMPVQGEKET